VSLLPVPELGLAAPGLAAAPAADPAVVLRDPAMVLRDPAVVLRDPGVVLPRPAVVLVGHGSRDPRSSATMRALADGVARRWVGPVTAAFLDFDPPSVPGALRAVVDHPGGMPIVVPALLTRAYHGRVDLPEVLASAPVPTRLAAVLGPAAPGETVDPLLVTALLRRVSEVEARFDGLALLAAGTSQTAARSTVEEVAAALADLLHVPCTVGYASASTPGPAEAVEALRARGCRRVVGAAYFLAPGRLYTAAVTGARAAGAIAVAAPLGAANELVELVLARAAAVLARV
jgi:sirohydrochlorin ferrochelatase